ncbi:MAG: DUF3240 family protein [Gammaproteobacteria bacterium]|nr:DUF3240 family protein [Gammaproteobacteria bacterium]MDQ7075674.1 DUF3240 family protein [Gammaproteobacteria bacterium]
MSESCLMTLVSSPEVEESLLDWLLGRVEVSGFSSHKIDGHSRDHMHLSLAEQVSGRRRQVMFHIQLNYAVAETLLQELKESFPGMGVHYWLTPVMAAGRIE